MLREKVKSITDYYFENPPFAFPMMIKPADMQASVGVVKVNNLIDYKKGINSLPKSDVLRFVTDFGTVVVRPSGTEPKLKLYLSIRSDDRTTAEEIDQKITNSFENVFLKC